MTYDLGKPEFQPYCSDCNKTVGGFYFDKSEANGRLREHNVRFHNGSASWYHKLPAVRNTSRRTMGAYQ